MDFEDAKRIGNMAEDLVEKLLEEAGYEVFRYGWEHSMDRFLDYTRDEKITGVALDYIRHMPDFVVVSPDREVIFVEVKFRSEGLLKSKDLFNYPACYVLFLTKNGILAQNVVNLKNGEKFKELNEVFHFSKIPKYIIEKYDKIIRRKLGDESFLGQIWSGWTRKEPPTKTGMFESCGRIVSNEEAKKEYVEYDKDKEQTPCEDCRKSKPNAFDYCKECYYKRIGKEIV